MVAESILKEMTDVLVSRFGPEKVILFGSQARGAADARSDVDLLVVCSISESRRALMTAMDRALRPFKIARDIIVLSPEEFERDRQIPGTVARPASQEGRALYGEL